MPAPTAWPVAQPRSAPPATPSLAPSSTLNYHSTRTARWGRVNSEAGMSGKFAAIFGSTKPVIAMVHLGALPGAPLYDAEAGLRGLSKGCARTSGAAGGGLRCRHVRQRERPALRVQGRHRLDRDHGLCDRPAARRDQGAVRRQRAVGSDEHRSRLRRRPARAFVREIFTGTYASDMGPWTPDAGKAMRYRDRLGRQRPGAALQHLGRVRLFARPAQPAPTGRAARCSRRIPDAILVSGAITGEAAAMSRPRGGEAGAARHAGARQYRRQARDGGRCAADRRRLHRRLVAEGRRQHLERGRSGARARSSCGLPARRAEADAMAADAHPGAGAAAGAARRADADPGLSAATRAGCGGGSPGELDALGLDIAHRPARQSDRDARRRRRCAERHAVRAHGPARLRRAQDRGERA